MYGLKKIMDNIELTVLNIEFHAVGKEWNYANVNNPYSRIYYITQGKGIIENENEVIKNRSAAVQQEQFQKLFRFFIAFGLTVALGSVTARQFRPRPPGQQLAKQAHLLNAMESGPLGRLRDSARLHRHDGRPACLLIQDLPGHCAFCS